MLRINKWWACHLHYSITSLNIYIYAHRREQWMEQCREKKAPRSNRALFDLRDKDKKNRYRERGRGYYAYTFWTGYTPHTHTQYDRYVNKASRIYMYDDEKKTDGAWFLSFCLYNKHIRFDLFHSQLFLIVTVTKISIANDAFCFYFGSLRSSDKIFFWLSFFLVQQNNNDDISLNRYQWSC